MSSNRATDDLVVWTFDFALTTFYEIDADLIQPLLPRRLRVIEVAPGVGLINVTAFNFPKGALGTLPEFQELIFSAIVSPDLTRGVPKFAMYVMSLASTCQQHLDHSNDYYQLPIHGRLTDVTIDKNNLSVRYGDHAGKILTMRNCSETPNYKDEERYFQAYSSKDGIMYIADLRIKARLYEHQLSGDAGTLHKHPFFHDLDMEDADPTPYLQMISEPGKQGLQFYHRPEVFK